MFRTPVALALLLVAGNAGADDVPPNAAFLEYLGSWEGTDEDWLMIRRGIRAYDDDDNERSDPVPEGDESQEHNDEN
ncbi:MAG: hypothetical protein U5K38_10660 [Woeseiaceae bacterium]|nr:hypothetical protein [Woeseiaceae bacterium]